MIARATATYRDGLFDELIIDNFAGGGGAGLGIELALGRPVDHAINHDAEALAMHRVNHPGTEHHHSDVWEVDPLEVTQGRPVGLAWFSTDCKHFSKAKGGKPVSPRVRGLAWVVVKWAKAVRPRVIMLENVEEFQTWGPLTDAGLPCPKRKGETFEAWKQELRDLGYEIEHRELRACDYGAPTIRKRLFLVARCDGEAIVWPEVTHGEGIKLAGIGSEESKHSEESAGYADHQNGGRQRSGRGVSVSKRRVGGRDKSEGAHGNKRSARARLECLKPYRTAAECIDWSIPCPSIFERKRPLADNTMRRIAAGIKRYVLDSASPFLVSIANYGGNGAPVHSIDDPLTTVTANPKGGHHAVCVPTLVATNHGDSGGRRSYPIDEPCRTVVASSRGGEALVAAFMAKHYGGMVGCPIDKPAPTQTTRGTQNQVVAAHLTHLYGSNKKAAGGDPEQPLKSVTAGGLHAGLVAALLVKYYGNEVGGHSVEEPLHTIPTRDRYGLVTVELEGEPYVITDIGMRMLQPRELYRAQGFGDDYVIDRGVTEDGEAIKLTKTAQVRMCGNSVCPPMAEALVRANVVSDVPDHFRGVRKMVGGAA